MVANNMTQLEQMIKSQMQKAMNVAAEKMKADVYDEVYSFYTMGNPTMYVRTGALGDTPRVSPITSMGKSISYTVYLDTSHQYNSGDTPSMQQVLDLAEDGTAWTTKGGASARPTLGKGGFWKRSEQKFQQTLNSVIGSFFR